MDGEEQAKKMQKVIAKAWADEAFRQKLLADPSATLKEEGLETPPGVEVRVLESTDEVYYFVLPPKPSDVDLDDLDTREAAYWCHPFCV